MPSMDEIVSVSRANASFVAAVTNTRRKREVTMVVVVIAPIMVSSVPFAACFATTGWLQRLRASVTLIVGEEQQIPLKDALVFAR